MRTEQQEGNSSQKNGPWEFLRRAFGRRDLNGEKAESVKEKLTERQARANLVVSSESSNQSAEAFDTELQTHMSEQMSDEELQRLINELPNFHSNEPADQKNRTDYLARFLATEQLLGSLNGTDRAVVELLSKLSAGGGKYGEDPYLPIEGKDIRPDEKSPGKEYVLRTAYKPFSSSEFGLGLISEETEREVLAQINAILVQLQSDLRHKADFVVASENPNEASKMDVGKLWNIALNVLKAHHYQQILDNPKNSEVSRLVQLTQNAISNQHLG